MYSCILKATGQAGESQKRISYFYNSLNAEKQVFWRPNWRLTNFFKIKLDEKRQISTTSVKYLGVLSDIHWTCLLKSNVSRWTSTEQMKYSVRLGTTQTFTYSKWYNILYLEPISFMPTSYGIKTKKHKTTFEISKTEHSKKIK